MGSGSPPPSTPRSPRAGPSRNQATILPSDPRAARAYSRSGALSPEEAYEKALHVHRGSATQTEIGYRLYAVDRTVRAARDVKAEIGGHAVIGRHTQCDLVLDEASTVSLRHVLVRASALDDGMPVLMLLDLDTSDGFELSDGSFHRSVVAIGPVVFRVGRHSLVALPSAGKLPDKLQAPEMTSADSSARRVIDELGSQAADPREPDTRGSHITIVPRASQLPECGVMGRSAQLAGGSATSASCAYEIALESAGRRSALFLEDREVERGILVGRAPKCLDAGLRQVLNNGVSRVHALIVRERTGAFLYDIASTNGTFCDRRRVRCVELDDGGTTVRLEGTPPLYLDWRRIED